MDLTRFIYGFMESQNMPVLSAFLIGLLASISPCPLATNITAVAYMSRDIKNPSGTVINGLMYTLGRAASYMFLAAIIYFGYSSFKVSRLFQGWGDKALGPALIVLGLVMLGVIRPAFRINNPHLESLKEKIAGKGYWGAFFLGALFAFAFCPYSGVLFFGIFMPLVLRSREALLLPPLFALGTGIPVILFSWLIAYSMKKMSSVFTFASRVEKISRYAVAVIFILAGVYYLQYLAKYLISLIW